jgi:hypothetical protein
MRNRQVWLIQLIQDAYIRKILYIFYMEDCTLASTPIYPSTVDFKLYNPEDKAPTEFIKQYQLLIGSLLYLYNWTWPNIAWAVGKLY